MTTKELSALTRRLAQNLPDVVAKADSLIVIPVTHTLRCILLERSADPRLFYVNVFFQPLFLPAEHEVLNLGWRIGGGTHRWNADATGLVEELGAALRRDALPFLLRINSVDDFLEAANGLHQPADGYTEEAIAYALAKAERFPDAQKALCRYAAKANRSIAWQKESAERAECLAAAISSDPPAARLMLSKWEDETARCLDVAAFRPMPFTPDVES